MNTTEQNNRLISEFMGITPTEINGKYSLSDSPFFATNCDTSKECLDAWARYAKYHTSYDWIFPVIEEIEKHIYENDVYYSIEICGGCYVTVRSSTGEELFLCDTGNSKLECIYQAVLQFIHWHNAQKA